MVIHASGQIDESQFGDGSCESVVRDGISVESRKTKIKDLPAITPLMKFVDFYVMA